MSIAPLGYCACSRHIEYNSAGLRLADDPSPSIVYNPNEILRLPVEYSKITACNNFQKGDIVIRGNVGDIR
jgi:hypothetical protein